MEITYKLVSDWNLKTDFDSSVSTGGIISIALDSFLSSNNNGGSYDLAIDSSSIRHGTFSKSVTHNLYYFTYSNLSREVSVEKILIDNQDINGINSRLSFDNSENPIIVYYDTNSFSIAALTKNGAEWGKTNIDYVNLQSPYQKRQLDTYNINGKIYGAYVHKFNEDQSAIQYIYFNGNSWVSETVATDDEDARFITAAIIVDKTMIPTIFVGTSAGIFVYQKIRKVWQFDRQYLDSASVNEISAAYDSSRNYSHVVYLSGTTVKYQRYDNGLLRTLNRFLISNKYIDFNSSSVSIDVNSLGDPCISYSHAEEGSPIKVYLKTAIGSAYGDLFKTYNITGYSNAMYVGYLSDLIYDANDRMCILYYDGGIKIYDEQTKINEENIAVTTWKDKTFSNNLLSSNNPPTRDAQNTYMNFSSNNEQYFYIIDENCTDLDEGTTGFSILFSIIPAGGNGVDQVIVSKSSSVSGYKIFLTGEYGLSLAFNIFTVYGNLNETVVDLPINETTKIGFVYSGYDVKVYVKKPEDEKFTVYKYDIFGDVKKTNNPFVIGAYGEVNWNATQSSESSNSSSSTEAKNSSSTEIKSSSSTEAKTSSSTEVETSSSTEIFSSSSVSSRSSSSKSSSSTEAKTSSESSSTEIMTSSSNSESSSSSSSTEVKTSSSTEIFSSSSTEIKTSSSTHNLSTSSISESSDSSSGSAEEYLFSYFLNAKLICVRYWKRELNYAEASYNDSDVVSYINLIDPYSDEMDYNIRGSSCGTTHFVMHGEDLGVIDYGGIDKINLLSYSNYDSEERITNSTGYSIDPFLVKKQNGEMCLLYADKKSGYSEIYLNNFNGNNSSNYLVNNSSFIKCYGRNGSTTSMSNVFVDPRANFLNSGVYIGDFLCITSGSDYIGLRVPIIGILGQTCLEIGVYFSKSLSDLGYYIDKINEEDEDTSLIQLTSLSQDSINPVAVADTISDLHAVWQSVSNENYDIYYQRYRTNNSVHQIWGSVKLTDKVGNSINPSLAIDSEDVLHLVWEDTRNKNHSIMYAKSSKTVQNGEDQFVNWSSSNFGGIDLMISSSYSESPVVAVDNNDIVHIAFSTRLVSTDDSKYEIFYCNNKTGIFSAPIRITNLEKKSRTPKIVVDKNSNVYVFFSCKHTDVENIYMVKYDFSQNEWTFPKRISFSEVDSVMPSVVIDSDDIIYIYWVEKTSTSNSVGFSKYNTILDRLNSEIIRPSSSPNNIDKISTAIDETKTVYLAWEDGRLGSEYGTEIYKNQSINLINFDQIVSDSSKTKTDEEIISEDLNKFVIGKKYSDNISPSELPLSLETSGDVVLTLFTDKLSYEYPVDIFNLDNPLQNRETIILDYRDISIKIKGLPRTLAYRIKNLDDAEASYSEFREFTIDVFPDTTIASWRLSSGNGAKSIGIQLYTLHGLLSPIVVNLYLNEKDIYDIALFNNEGDKIGEAVDTEYQNKTVLSSKIYWVKIKPYKVIGDEQVLKFDVITQGDDIRDVETSYDGTYYVGKFSINPYDGIRHIDGSARIIPKVVDL